MNLRLLLHFFILLFSLLFKMAPPASAGCGVNFDKMRKRRIEAIRGQILSKLGMSQLPSNVDPPPVDRHIEEMYNRTRDFLRENARQKRQKCEEQDDEYYAQEIVTVNMKAPTTDENNELPSLKRYKSRKVKKEQSEFFSFDLQPQHIDPDAIVSANLRLYQEQIAGTPHGGRQQVELYHLALPELDHLKPPRHFVAMKQLDTYGEGWINFDLTSVVREWARIPKLNQGVEVTVPCEDEESTSPTSPRSSTKEPNKLKIVFAGSAAYERQLKPRGDDEEVPVMRPSNDRLPHLVVMVRIPVHHSKSPSSNHRRNKRSLDADYCFRRKPDEANCCLRELFIDFRQDLGWKWIHAPTGYNANFCAGACPYLWSMDTQHATILSLYKSMNPQASSSPCCSPKELEPLTIMYYDKGKYKLIEMSDMVLLSCKCS